MTNSAKQILHIDNKIIKPTVLLSVAVLAVAAMGLKFGGLLGVYLLLFGLITGLYARYISLQKIIVISVLMSLLIFAASYWQGSLWAITIIVGVAALVSGFLDKFAIGSGHLLPVAVAVAGMVGHSQPSMYVASLALLGCFIGVLLIYILKIHQKPTVATAIQLKVNTVALVLLAAIFAHVSIKYNLPHGYWAIFTLCAVLKPAAGETLQTIRKRVSATIVGAIVGLLVVIILPHWVSMAGALISILFLVYFMLKGNYTPYVIALTVLIVLLMSNGEAKNAVSISELRLGLTVLSSAITGIVALLLWRLQRLLSNKPNAHT